MWSYRDMLDFPMTDLLDDHRCTNGLERHLPPEGWTCPHCGRLERRRFRHQGHVPAYRCRVCYGSDTLRTGTVFAKPHQPPATLVLLRRGRATGASTARLARELRLSRTQLPTLRQRLPTTLHVSAPTTAMTGTVFEADERYHHAGEKRQPPSRCP